MEEDSSELSLQQAPSSRWAHVLGSGLIVVLALVLWRVAQWRRREDDEYARVQLYEDRPFAYASSSGFGSPIVASRPIETASSWSREVFTVSEEVQDTQRLIAEALDDDDSPRRT